MSSKSPSQVENVENMPGRKYAYKRIRGSKGLIPKADIENCRTEIRQKTRRYSQ